MANKHPISIDDIHKAAALLEGRVLRTPTIPSQPLSDKGGTPVFLKLENLQLTGSFKTRGAFIKLNSLNQADRKQGVIAASAGNHAQGVAYHARHLGIPATIVMPVNTPFNKVARTESMGAAIQLQGDDLTESQAFAEKLSAEQGLIFIHPYDDPAIIAGQGTIGLEILEDVPELDALLVPVGGGGLISGIAIACKALKPELRIFGVEVAQYASMKAVLSGDEPPTGGQTVAEGIAVKTPGDLTRKITSDLAEDILLVDEESLEKAIQVFLMEQRIVVEGAGAATLAALLSESGRFAGLKTGLVVSGGNADSRLLSSILMRGLVREGRLVRLRIEITDSPGTLAKISGLIGDCGGNIVEVYHQRLFYDIPVKMAEVDVVVETLDEQHVRTLIRTLKESGFETRLLSSTSGDIKI